MNKSINSLKFSLILGLICIGALFHSPTIEAAPTIVKYICNSYLGPDYPALKNDQLEQMSSEKLVERQGELVDGLLSDYGKNPIQSFENELNKSEKISNPVKQLFKEENFDFAIHAPEDYRMNIVQEGFKHTKETGNSYTGSSEYVNQRDQIEASYLRMPYEQYQKLAPSMKPKYGLLRPVIGSEYKAHNGESFGGDIWILKKDKLKNRVTFTLGDSLNQSGNMFTNLLPMIASMITKRIPHKKSSNWSEFLFLPWSHKSLMIPAVNYSMEMQGSLEVPPVWSSKFQKWIFSKLFGRVDKELADKVKEGLTKNELGIDDYAFSNPSMLSQYVELQFWGELDNPKLFEKFIFTKKEPTVEEMKFFKQHGIEVYDGRNEQTPVRWE